MRGNCADVMNHLNFVFSNNFKGRENLGGNRVHKTAISLYFDFYNTIFHFILVQDGPGTRNSELVFALIKPIVLLQAEKKNL